MEEVTADPTDALLCRCLLTDAELQDAESRYPGYIRLREHGRYGARLTVFGEEIHYNLIGGDVRDFESWQRRDPSIFPEQLQKLARHRAAEAILGVRENHRQATARRRKRKLHK